MTVSGGGVLGKFPKPETGEIAGRRTFLTLAAGAAAVLVLWLYEKRAPAEAEPPSAATASGGVTIVRILEFTDAGVRKDIADLPKVVKSESEWRKQLSPGAFRVTRRAGTEIPFTGEYWNLHEKGLFRCVCCGTALFSSETKFDSGTGWPSFWAPIAPENVADIPDNSLLMMRTAVSCRRCDAHLGHVFTDGPQPTGLRYCINSVVLRFVKAA